MNPITYAAEQEGFFAKNGIKADLVSVTSSTAGVAAMEGGSLDVLSASPDAALPFLQKGVDLRLIAGQDSQFFVIAANKNITSSAPYPANVKALEGKTIAVTSIGSGAWAVLLGTLKDAGISQNSVHIVGVGGAAAGVAALESGRVDAAVTDDGSATKASSAGVHVLVDLRQPDVGPASVRGDSYVGEWVTQSYLQAHPQVVQALRKSFAEADMWLHDQSNTAAVQALYSTIMGPEVPQASIPAFVASNLPVANSYFSRASLAAWAAFDHEYGILKTPVDVGPVFASGTPETPQAVSALAAG